MTQKIKFSIFLLLMVFAGFIGQAMAQKVGSEPETVPLPEPKSPLSYGYHNGLGFNLIINNFGFGIGGQYRKVLTPMSEMTFDLHITGLRNVTEQTFYDFFGQQIIPNKYNRVLSFPLMIGFKHRLFAKKIEDNFRIYAAAAGGPTLAFIYPYFKDYNQNHIRDDGTYAQYEPINDIFSGWKDGHSEVGGAGKVVMGIDFGSKFKNITSVEFGFYFQYFPKGIQMLEPRKYGAGPNNQLITLPAASKQKYFGTPLISLVFGGMW
jgi:hypothetical protein